ncbi:hypothetical protein L1887_53592 [Cichorium endivia]|nr:hypothetical protein L1887_53592 [Cichorium endivia]
MSLAKRMQLKEAAIDRQHPWRHNELLAHEPRVTQAWHGSEVQSATGSLDGDGGGVASHVSKGDLGVGGRDALDAVDEVAHEAGGSKSGRVGALALLLVNLELREKRVQRLSLFCIKAEDLGVGGAEKGEGGGARLDVFGLLGQIARPLGQDGVALIETESAERLRWREGADDVGEEGQRRSGQVRKP